MRTIMTVDDSASLRQMVSVVLRGGGYAVIEAKDGLDALAQLQARELSLILTDINMRHRAHAPVTGDAAAQVRSHRAVDHRIASREEAGGQGGRSHRVDRKAVHPGPASGGGEEGRALTGS